MKRTALHTIIKGDSIMRKKVVAIHDISCMGRCSLTVALPILSAAGIETRIIPTAILSTHTAGFENYTFRDLTDDIEPIVRHWKTLNVHNDGIYTGYLGSERQLDIISHVFDELCTEQTLIAVDPVMADNGSLYPAFSEDFPAGMARLVAKAHVAIPNITEACLLLGMPYQELGYTEHYIRELLTGMAALGPGKVVITGVQYDASTIGAASFDRETNTFSYVSTPKVDGYFHGTGDVYSSGLVAGLLNGMDLARAAQTAIHLTYNSILATLETDFEARYGVDFEQILPAFIDELAQKP